MSLVLAGALLMSPQPVSDAEPTLTSTKRIATRVSTMRVERLPPLEVAEEPALPEPPSEPPAPDPPPEPVPEPPGDASGADWDAIAQCESGGNWGLVTTGNGFYFALQFHPDTWVGYGGDPAYLTGPAPSKALQIEVAERVLAGQGPGAWPNCFAWE